MKTKLNGWYWVIAIVVIVLFGVIYTRYTVAAEVETATATGSTTQFEVKGNGVALGCYTGLQMMAGVYNFSGTCVAPPGEPPATTPPASIVVNGVTLPLLRYANVSYGATNRNLRTNVALTEYMNLFSVNSATGPLNPSMAFPGIGSQPVLRSIPKLFYIALHFKTPATGPWTSQYTYSDYAKINNFAPLLTVAISKFPGDFATGLATPGCVRSSTPAANGNLLLAKSTTNAGGSWCNLQPNTDYWFNVMPSEPLVTPTVTTQIVLSRTN